MSPSEPDTLVWRKSSFSGGNGDCIEVASEGGATLVRDTKDPRGPVIALPEISWRGLLQSIR